MHNNYNKDNDYIVKKANKIKSSDNFVFVWSITAVLISVLISFGIVFATNTNWMPDNIKDKIEGLISGISDGPGIPLLGKKQNILLLGVDSNGNTVDPFKGARSDTVIILSIDPFSKTANALSIPRDSKVYLANHHGLDKINAAHAVGGPNLTIKTIEETFGMRIHHYIAIDYQGIKELVNAVGGVPLTVEKRMMYTDHSAGLRINLHPGYQTLDADQAEGYLRFRHDAVGDIGRVKRQQWFIRSLVKKLQSPDMIVKIPQIIQLASKYIRTDMNFYELSQLAAYTKSIDLDNVQTATLPGRPSKFGNVSYWILDTEKSQEIIDRLIYRESLNKRYEGLTVSLMHSTNSNADLEEIKNILKKSDYKVTCESSTRDPRTQIIAHTKYATLENAKYLKRKIPVLQDAHFSVITDNYPCGETDLTIVLSGTSDN
ncbi:MAG: cell envelope-related transcriptional attenuator [uncultured bacterium]|nr:MAG: cell envelope-related transcriptional attenuator [uncultured bacterium]HBH17671.1 hypothetical protein [Cyanobacteria bacterium UBA9579]